MSVASNVTAGAASVVPVHFAISPFDTPLEPGRIGAVLEHEDALRSSRLRCPDSTPVRLRVGKARIASLREASARSGRRHTQASARPYSLSCPSSLWVLRFTKCSLPQAGQSTMANDLPSLGARRRSNARRSLRRRDIGTGSETCRYPAPAPHRRHEADQVFGAIRLPLHIGRPPTPQAAFPPTTDASAGPLTRHGKAWDRLRTRSGCFSEPKPFRVPVN